MTKPQPLYIGIDIGTSGVRACAINQQGEIQHSCNTSLPPPDVDQHSVTQYAELWWEATRNVLVNIFSVIDASQVQSISVNGTSGTVLVCDKDGNPVAPARMYNDAFCTDQANKISSVAPPQSAAHGTSSGLAKLLYLQQKFPQAVYLCHQTDWIVGKLSGRFDITDQNNALKTGYDPIEDKWPDWFSQLNINTSLLPQVVAPGSVISTVLGELFPEIFNGQKLNPKCQIISGTTDSIAAFMATGASKPGDAVTSLGSTLVLKVISETPVSAPEFGIYSHKFGDYWLAGGASNSGGAVLLNYFTPQQLDLHTASLNSIQTGKNFKLTGLNYYPLLKAGERFPINDPLLEPILEPKPKTELEFFQAILEGISKIELDGYKKLQQLGAPFPTHIETTGGGSKNMAWNNIRQQTLGVPVKQAVFNEACYGSALLAMRGCKT